MPTIWQRVVNNPKSTIKGGLVFVITVSGVLAKSNVVSVNVASWCALASALAYALIQAYSLDADSVDAARAQAVAVKKDAAKNG